MAELASNMLADGQYFFKGRDFAWNIFDFVIVMVAVFELCMKMSGVAMHLQTWNQFTFVEQSFVCWLPLGSRMFGLGL